VYTVDVSELNRLVIDLGRLGDEAAHVARIAVRKTAADIKATAQAIVPVDTGNLRSSITFETRVTGHGATAEIGPSASYGGFVEFGTSRMGPHAYMGPALDRHGWQMEEAAGQIVARFGT
jgi:HK97 gp10 family phage protein